MFMIFYCALQPVLDEFVRGKLLEPSKSYSTPDSRIRRCALPVNGSDDVKQTNEIGMNIPPVNGINIASYDIYPRCATLTSSMLTPTI